MFLRWPVRLALLGAFALAIRLVYLYELRDSPFFSVLIGDSLQYDAWAQRIAAGEWLGHDVFYQSPLYPYLLGLFYSVAGHAVFGVRIVQAVLGAASVVLLATAGRHFFDARAGLIAGVLLAIYPSAIFFDGLIQKSSLDLFLMTGLLAGLGLARVDPRRRWLVLSGVALGALALNRENARVLYPVLALWVFSYPRSTEMTDDPAAGSGSRVTPLQRVALLTLGAALLWIPVAGRNAYVGGEFLVSTSQFGPNFYIGNRLGASGGYEPLIEGRGNAQVEREDAIRLAEQASGRSLSAGEVSDYWQQRAFDDIRKAPGAWLRLLARKTWMTFAATEPADTESMAAYSDASWILRSLQWFTFGVLLALAGFGVWVTRGRWRSLWVLHASFVVLALSVIVFYVFARYRYPLVPIAALFAGTGLAAVPSLWRAPARTWAPGVAGVCVALILLHIPARITSDDTYMNYGGELVRLGRPAEAVPLLEKAVATDPEDTSSRLTLALALQQTGQPWRAIEELKAAVRLAPGSAEAQAGLGAAFQQQGRAAEAIAHYEAAIRLRPSSVEAMSNLALAHAQAGNVAAAVAQFERALTMAPASFPLRMNMCSLLQEARRAPEAIACLQKAASVARQPAERLAAEYALAQALLDARQIDAALTSLERALAAAYEKEDAAAIATVQEALRIVRASR